MKDYWLVIDEETLSIEICFPDNKQNAVNACLATIHFDQQKQMLKRLREITADTVPFTMSYEYFKMEVDPYTIDCQFHMFGEPVEFYLITRIFRDALGEYLKEMDKLCKERFGK